MKKKKISENFDKDNTQLSRELISLSHIHDAQQTHLIVTKKSALLCVHTSCQDIKRASQFMTNIQHRLIINK